jgi:hypothetical protein
MPKLDPANPPEEGTSIYYEYLGKKIYGAFAYVTDRPGLGSLTYALWEDKDHETWVYTVNCFVDETESTTMCKCVKEESFAIVVGNNYIPTLWRSFPTTEEITRLLAKHYPANTTYHNTTVRIIKVAEQQRVEVKKALVATYVK